MQEINNAICFLESASVSFRKSLESELCAPSRSRYYLMQQDFHGIDKKLLKFVPFSSKADFHYWRDSLGNPSAGRLVEWTAGFLFKFSGDDHHYTLADKNGKEPKRVH